MPERVELNEPDVERIDQAIQTADRLYLERVHKDATALRTQDGLVFA